MSDLKVLFRTDATSAIGTGHFMRCLTLAEELKQRGAHICFVSRELPAHLRDMLAAKEIEFAALDREATDEQAGVLAHSHWLGISQIQDAQATIRALEGRLWDWLVVDHYALDADWESALRGMAKKIMVIDDIADREHDCDVLLDQNFYADMQTRYTGKVPLHCELLLGPCYALLRDEFRKLREQVKPRTRVVNRILVFFGGVDADNYTGKAIEALSEIDIRGVDVDVVIGARHPCLEEIKAVCVQQGFICYVQTDRMAELMAAADLAIGAGGTATWERCCLGLPTLVFCTADNQQKQLADAAREGLLYSPEITVDLNQAIQKHTSALIENASLRGLISRNSMQAVNGRGVLRVVAKLGISDIEIRMASPDDSLNLFQWRNHPSIREVSRNTKEIDWPDHLRWFDSVLANPEKMLLIGRRSESPVGVVRFDKQNDEVEISIYVVPEKATSGMGQNLLQSAEQWLAANHPEIRKIRAHVLGPNERSQRLFSGAGYQIESAYYLKRLH
ncbi:MAG: UDP-2,4-diacetamido-2,4,6-trideoxy-beta-L-altropyranose hydrolase [Gallionellaceae bacterium]|jgi:UDP-2,4-diacetamido-2,4,6-trideoxy-beta-L-altropyranose hydrolase